MAAQPSVPKAARNKFFGGSAGEKSCEVEVERRLCRITKVLGGSCEHVVSGCVIDDLSVFAEYGSKYKLFILTCTTDKFCPEKNADLEDYHLDFMKLKGKKTELRRFALASVAPKAKLIRRSTSGLFVIPVDPDREAGKKLINYLKSQNDSLNEGYSEGIEYSTDLFCRIIVEASESCFEGRRYDLKPTQQEGQYCLKDDHSSYMTLSKFVGTSNRKPRGAPILACVKEVLRVVGVLSVQLQNNILCPIWLSPETLQELMLIGKKRGKKDKKNAQGLRSGNGEDSSEGTLQNNHSNADGSTSADGVTDHVLGVNSDNQTSRSGDDPDSAPVPRREEAANVNDQRLEPSDWPSPPAGQSSSVPSPPAGQPSSVPSHLAGQPSSVPSPPAGQPSSVPSPEAIQKSSKL